MRNPSDKIYTSDMPNHPNITIYAADIATICRLYDPVKPPRISFISWLDVGLNKTRNSARTFYTKTSNLPDCTDIKRK